MAYRLEDGIEFSMKHHMINVLSTLSVHVKPVWESGRTETGTGFLVAWGRTRHPLDRRYFIITNWHVVSGVKKLNAVYDEWSSGYPHDLEITLVASDGRIRVYREPLCDGAGRFRWTELRRNGSRADLVALPLAGYANDLKSTMLGMSLFEHDNKLAIQPGEVLSIIGFPYGICVERYPIWKTGHLASDLALDYRPDWPSFLVDVTARPGMSGSPVFAVRYGLSRMANGTLNNTDMAFDFLGIYSGRVSFGPREEEMTELGIVWKRSLVRVLLEQAYSRAMNECSPVLYNMSSEWSPDCGDARIEPEAEPEKPPSRSSPQSRDGWSEIAYFRQRISLDLTLAQAWQESVDSLQRQPRPDLQDIMVHGWNVGSVVSVMFKCLGDVNILAAVIPVADLLLKEQRWSEIDGLVFRILIGEAMLQRALTTTSTQGPILVSLQAKLSLLHSALQARGFTMPQ